MNAGQDTDQRDRAAATAGVRGAGGPKHMRRRGLPAWQRGLLALAVLALLAAAAVVRAATLTPPPARAHILLTSDVTLPGSADLAWPAQGAAAMAVGTGSTVGTSGPGRPQPLASVTKVMTAYVVLKDHPLAPKEAGPRLTVSAAEAATLPARIAAGQSVLGVTAGESLTEYQALQALLLASADNIADDLAVQDAGSIAAFVAKMNATAASFGMTSTHYADASGLDPASASTPADQLRLAAVVMALPVFAAIVGQRSATIPGAGKVTNYDTLVGTDGFTGIKTGSTTPAGGCLMFSATRSVAGASYTFTGVVLGQRHGPYIAAALAAAKKLVDSAFAAIATRTVVAAGQPVLILRRAGRQETVTTTAPLRLAGLPGRHVTLAVAPAGTPGRYRLVARGGDGTSGRAALLIEPPPLAAPTFAWRVAHLFA